MSDRPTATPFLAALAIIVLIVVIVGVLNFLDADEPPAAAEVARAAVGQNDALQRQDYADFRTYTCGAQHRDKAEVIAGQRDSVAKRGERFVDEVTDVVVDGDRATAEVTYHFDDAPDVKTDADMTFAREDGAWKVCSPGPE